MASTSATPAAEDQGTKHSKSGTQAPAMLTSTQVISNPNPAAGVKDLTQDAIPPRNVGPSQAVRFASKNQEIEPSHSLHPESTLASSEGRRSPVELTPEAEAEIRTLSLSVHGSRLQQRRMSNFAFEPVSLPASRVPSNETTSREASRSQGPSPNFSPRNSAMPTPSISSVESPAGEGRPNDTNASGADLSKVHPDPHKAAPQTSLPSAESQPSGQTPLDPGSASSDATSRPSSTSGQVSTEPSSVSQGSGVEDLTTKRPKGPSRGPSEQSPAQSRDPSPSNTSEKRSGTSTPPAFSRPFTPVGDRDDPYARSKRAPQSKNLGTIDPRFVFEDTRRRSGILSSNSGSSLPRSGSSGDLKAQDRHHTGFSIHGLGGKKDHHAHLHEDSGSKHGSMSDLKRFFGLGHHKGKSSHSPSTSAKTSTNSSGTGSKTPPHQLPPTSVPFADDHGLQSKWGRFGKVLGSGAGGSVRLMKRSSDGVTFAVKQFRDQHSYETERDYSKKVTAEFCIGSTLHHGNIIETLDIVHEKGHWFEVMEYAPFDLFAIVMTGKMSRDEIACTFLQIVSGVTYLHSMGLAHRDLKLDNVVVNEHGIMKIIDFGSAVVFRYPFENDTISATGIVGSDPYLAPEVLLESSKKYDPQPTDVWSLAIIFACMSLRRFPWKAPRNTDNSFRLFALPPSPGTPPTDHDVMRASEFVPKSALKAVPADEPHRSSAPAQEEVNNAGSEDGADSHRSQHQHHHHNSHASTNGDDKGPHEPSATGPTSAPKQESKEPIKGPWRLLRLLPRETRNIIGKMLELNPRKRATLEDMMGDPWIKNTAVCSQVDGGKVIRASGHDHTLEPGTTDTPATSHK